MYKILIKTNLFQNDSADLNSAMRVSLVLKNLFSIVFYSSWLILFQFLILGRVGLQENRMQIKFTDIGIFFSFDVLFSSKTKSLNIYFSFFIPHVSLDLGNFQNFSFMLASSMSMLHQVFIVPVGEQQNLVIISRIVFNSSNLVSINFY